MIKKQMYAAPSTEVLELRLEGVIATSDPLRSNVGVNAYDDGFSNNGAGEETITW